MEDVRWLQRFENLSKIFKEFSKRIDYIDDVDEYLKIYLKKKKQLEELPLDLLKDKNLGESLEEELLEIDSILDSLIQKYEISYEMFIKTFRDLLLYQGEKLVELGSKEVLKKSLKFAYIQDHDGWMEVSDYRNNTSHDHHNEGERLEIIKAIIKKYYPLMKKAYTLLKQKSEQE